MDIDTPPSSINKMFYSFQPPPLLFYIFPIIAASCPAADISPFAHATAACIRPRGVAPPPCCTRRISGVLYTMLIVKRNSELFSSPPQLCRIPSLMPLMICCTTGFSFISFIVFSSVYSPGFSGSKGLISCP